MKTYYVITKEEIKQVESTISWFKENGKELIDYLFEDTLMSKPPSDGLHGEYKIGMLHPYVFSERNKLPNDIHAIVVEKMSHYVLFS